MTPNEDHSTEQTPLETIDKLIHEPARLLIMAQLYVVESADFVHVIQHTGLTWGNLSSHMSKLEAAGYVEVEKEIKGKKSHTTLYLTNKGREAFQTYRKRMKKMFDDLPD